MGLACALPACDLAETDNLAPLSGSWRATDLRVDGVSIKESFDTQYDRRVLTLRQGADGGEFFTLIGHEEAAENDLLVQGTVDVDGNELTPFPDASPPIELDYMLSDSGNATLQLRAEEGCARRREPARSASLSFCACPSAEA